MQRVNGGKHKIEINQEVYFCLSRIFIFINLRVPLSIGTVLSHTCWSFSFTWSELGTEWHLCC